MFDFVCSIQTEVAWTLKAEEGILKMGILVSVPFPISQGPIQFFASKCHVSYKILISKFWFPISDFLFLTSHFSFPISRVPLFHFNFLILHVSMSPLHNPSCLCLTQVFLAKTVIKHLWIIWALISQLVTWSGKQEMGNGKWEMGNGKWEIRNEKLETGSKK